MCAVSTLQLLLFVKLFHLQELTRSSLGRKVAKSLTNSKKKNFDQFSEGREGAVKAGKRSIKEVTMATKPQSTSQAPVNKSLRKLSVQNEYLL